MTAAATDDAALVRRAAGGDVLAFETLVRRHTDAVWRVARSMLRDDFAAEEAVQDTFLRAYRALGTFRGDAAVRTWLVSICTRVCVDRLRLRRPEVVPLEEAAARRTAPDPDDRVQLDAAVRGLAPDERAAFLLVDVLGYTSGEAAAVAGAPASTLRSRLGRAREQLAAALAPAGVER
ncbi:MAG TPA: sigma-70 family RNA polymerase sigma factor [Frankiaceae bacterium]|nr:sigma-70 family RNA polymerase sigma factor [Frankiaceae bacterium]